MSLINILHLIILFMIAVDLENHQKKQPSKNTKKASSQNLEKLNMVSDTALQSLTLSHAICLSKKRPRGIEPKVTVGSTQDLKKIDPKQTVSLPLNITKVLLYETKTYEQMGGMRAHRVKYKVPADPHGYYHSATQGILKPALLQHGIYQPLQQNLPPHH